MAKYIWPVPAWTGINQLFGTFPGGFNPPGGHTGTDYGTPIGTPIRAIADGVVKHAGWFRGSYYDNPWLVEPSFAGIVVVIDHGECLSVYAHLNDTGLNVGQRIRQGEIIGHSGNTRDGKSVFGPHLHFEIMPDGWSVNNGTYGRVNPGRYCTEYWGTATETVIKPGNTGGTTNKPTTEGFLMALTSVQQDKLLKLVEQIAGYTDTKTSAVAGKVWGTMIWREGVANTALQELADNKTGNLEIRATLAAQGELIAQLAKGGQTIDYARIESAVKDSVKGALADGIDISASITAGTK